MFDTDAATDAAIAAGLIKAANLIDFYVKTSPVDPTPVVLRAWDWPGSASYPGTVGLDGSTSSNSYESLCDRVAIAWNIRMAASLASEPLAITLDASRSADDSDWTGRFVDSDWHQSKVRVRQVALDWDSEALATKPLREWRGRLDHREMVQDPQSATLVWNVTCQGGLFRIRGRRLKTRSHADQQIRAPGDNFYIGTANMVGRPLNFAKAVGNIPGRATGSGGGATGGGSSGGSGGNGPNKYNPALDDYR